MPAVFKLRSPMAALLMQVWWAANRMSMWQCYESALTVTGRRTWTRSPQGWPAGDRCWQSLRPELDGDCRSCQRARANTRGPRLSQDDQPDPNRYAHQPGQFWWPTG